MISKTTPPDPSGALPRERLFSRLDQGMRLPLLHLAAPAGYGKSLLISSFLASRRIASLWYRIDEGDRDPAFFFHHLATAARAALDRDLSLPRFTPEYRHDLAAFTGHFFSRLLAGIKPPFCLVFDDLQAAPPGSPLAGIICRGIASLPAGANAITISREPQPPEFVRMLANGMMSLAGREEIRDLVRLRGGLGDEAAEEISAAARGWAAGAVLMIEARRRGEIPAPGRAAGLVFDYLALEVFNTIPDDSRDLLLKTAFLDEITPARAADIGCSGGAGEILSRLCAGNCLIERHHSRETVYRYHPLFRDFLLARGQQEFAPNEVRQIRLRSARIIARDGDPDLAGSILAAAGEWQHLAALVLDHAGPMIAQGRDRRLLEMISSLPDEHGSDPWLAYWEGVCRMPTGPAAARPLFARALDGFAEKGCRRGMLRAWAGVVDTFIHGRGSLGQLDRWIAFIDRLPPEGDPVPAGVESEVNVRMFAALAMRKPWHEDFSLWRDRAVACLDHGPNLPLRMMTGFYLHTAAVWSGDYQMAVHLRERLERAAGDLKRSPLAAITLKVVEAWDWLSGDCARTMTVMGEGLALAGETGIHIWDFILMLQGAAASLSTGDLATAGALLEKMAGVEPGRILDRFYYHYER